MLCLAVHLGAGLSKGIWTTPNSNGPADSVLRLVKVGRWGIAIKTDTWTASIVDLSYPPMLSCFLRLDVLDVSSAARDSAGGGPGTGRGGISREGGCESEDRDEFNRPPMRTLPSIVIVLGSGIGPTHGWVGDGGTGGICALFGFFT
jgi:hypothetical protein